jgi:hypothetical protein
MVGKEPDSYFQVYPRCETAVRFDHRETLQKRAAGKFRLGTNQLLVNDRGSSISFDGYTIAFVNEREKPAHAREWFTVGY